MAKAKGLGLVAKAHALPLPKKRSWIDGMDDELRADLLDFRREYQAGKLKSKLPSANAAFQWIKGEIPELPVEYQGFRMWLAKTT